MGAARGERGMACRAWRESRLGRRSVLRAGRRGRRGAADRRRSDARREPLRFGKRARSRWAGAGVEAEGFRLAQRGDPAQFIAFTADFPFYALAPSWSGEGDPGGSVELLWSADGVTWSEPIWIGRSVAQSAGPTAMAAHIGSLVSTPGASFCSTGPTTAPATSRRCRGSRSTTSTPSAGPSLEQVANPATDARLLAAARDQPRRLGRGRITPLWQRAVRRSSRSSTNRSSTSSSTTPTPPTSTTRCWRCARSTTSTPSPAAGATSPTTTSSISWATSTRAASAARPPSAATPRATTPAAAASA